MSDRITPSEVGPIHHRPSTRLTELRRCAHGHLAPKYKSFGGCAACAKNATYERRAARGKPVSPRLRRWPDYRGALEHHIDAGGYLLRLDGGEFGTTDNERTAARLRGAAWVDRCEVLQCWDEIAIAAHIGKPRRA